jgi:hypothetical protein
MGMNAVQNSMKQRVLQVRRPQADAPRPYDNEFVPAVTKIKVQPGVKWKAFNGAFPWVPSTATLKPTTSGSFKPYRRNVEFKNSQEVEIRPLLEHLTFIKNKKRWGFYLISGFREISKEDFYVIRSAMK